MGFSNEYSLSDLKAVTDGDGFGGGNGWWIILLFILLGGWNNGGYAGSGAANNYVLASDFATLQRQISDSSNMLERRTDNIINGLSSIGYNEAQLINGVNQTVTASGYETRNAIQGIGTQMASCCCDLKEKIGDVKYTMAMDTNAITNAVNQGFCQTNFNNQQNTRDIIANNDANTRAILERLTQDKIDALRDENATLRLNVSQTAQNQYLVNEIKGCPKPAYIVPNPYAYSGCGCGC